MNAAQVAALMATAAERNATRKIIRLAASQGRMMRGRPLGHYASLTPKLLSVPRDPLLPTKGRKKGRQQDEKRRGIWLWWIDAQNHDDDAGNVGPGRQIIRQGPEDLPEP